MRPDLAALLAIVLGAAQIAAAAFPTKEGMESPFDDARAMRDIETLLEYTPRSPGMPGHEKTIVYIASELAKTPANTIALQRWSEPTNEGPPLALTNIIARAYPEIPRRIIAGTHYDSIVRAYRDKDRPDAPMPGANNSASGVAVLLEAARALARLPAPPIGIDFVFFDGEEGPKSLGGGDPDWRALGSPHFAARLGDFYTGNGPLGAVILDMVCDRDLVLRPEQSSLHYAAGEVRKFWDIGRDLAPGVFKRSPLGVAIDDDHTALAKIGIPSFLVIDFAYEPWFNTTGDMIDKCSHESLDAVGRTLLRYFYAP